MSKVTLWQLDGCMPMGFNPKSFVQKMGYVIKTKNDKLIVIDGGYTSEGDYVLSFLKKIGGEKPVVDAWFFTHMHCDHTDAFSDIMARRSDEIVIKNVYYNFPDRDYVSKIENGASLPTYDNFFANFDKFKDVAKILQIGDRVEIDGLEFEVIFISDFDKYIKTDLNNTSMVFTVKAEEQKILFLGDLGPASSDDLINTVKSEKLKSDIVQMAHHGQGGINEDAYKIIAPKCCLWDAPDWLWDNDRGEGFNTHGWLTVITRGWMQDLGVKHHIVNKNGITALELPADFSDMSWGQEPDVK